jgi:hypothetical protein
MSDTKKSLSSALFPETKGKNLEGKSYLLPQDFEGELNLVIIAFQREQQNTVDTWLPTADLMEKLHTKLRYYELPVIARVNPLARWFIRAGMRSGIKDPKSRQKTITLYLDKTAFRKALGIDTEENIHVLLVDKKGKTAWRTEGACSVRTGESLSDFIKSYLGA